MEIADADGKRSPRPSRGRWHATGAMLRHPLFATSLALLALNDHVLKANLSLPRWLTGKLSDVVGPIVAGVVLAALIGATDRRARALAFAAAAAAVAAINVEPACARAAETLAALVGLRWTLTVDPTDLLALLPLPWLCQPLLNAADAADSPGAAESAAGQPRDRASATDARGRSRWRRGLEATLLLLGAAASAATSQSPSPVAPPLSLALGWDAHLVIGNRSGRDVHVRLRRLAAGVQLACGEVATAPSEVLDERLFGAGQTFALLDGRTMPLGGTLVPDQLGLDPTFFEPREGCDAVLVEAAGLSPRLVFWQVADLPMIGVGQEVATSAPERTVAFEADADGGLRWASHTHVFAAPAVAGAPPPACALENPALVASDSLSPLVAQPGDVGSAAPATLELKLLAITEHSGGCLELTTSTGKRWVCLPPAAFPFQPGDALTLRGAPLAMGGGTLTGYELTSGTHRLRVGRGAAPVLYGAAGYSVAEVADCGVVHEACGEVGERIALAVKKSALLPAQQLGLGVAFELGEERTLWVTQAHQRLTAHPGCHPGSELGVYFETVLRERL